VTSEPSHDEAVHRLAAIVASSDDAIVSKDLNGIVTSWNQGAERIFGWSPEEMVGQSIRTIIPPDRQSEEDDALACIRRGERLDHFETVRQRKNGSLVPISLTVSPILDADGRVVGASKIARDISERHAAALERERLLTVARDASRLKDEFLATLSHELRTPLNAVLGYVRMVRSGLVTEDKRDRAMETIERNANALTQMVEDILDVSRIIAGKLRLDARAMDLGDVVKGALAAVTPAAEARGISLETVLDPRTGPVTGDPERLQQVVWNLLSNAVKFTGRGGHVQVRVERVESHVEIVVSDTGVGIPPDFLPHVFERFRQADATTTRERGGLGLGLSITRHIVESHGGTVHAASGGEGKGSTFRVALPLRVVHEPQLEERAHPHAESIPSIPLPLPDLRGIVVLIVDDDRDALRLVREILEAAGATVATAESAMEALSALEAVRPHVLVADLGMPHMDGFELVSRVRQMADQALRGTPAAALTAYARSEDRTRVLRSGFQMHLTKPIAPGELMAAIAVLARRSEAY
jgi:PAS domain S-box-containing protein